MTTYTLLLLSEIGHLQIDNIIIITSSRKNVLFLL